MDFDLDLDRDLDLERDLRAATGDWSLGLSLYGRRRAAVGEAGGRMAAKLGRFLNIPRVLASNAASLMGTYPVRGETGETKSMRFS